MMARGQTLETDGELDVAGANNVLDLEIRKLCVETWGGLLAMCPDPNDTPQTSLLTQLLDDPGILAASKFRIILRLGASHNHLSTGKDQGSRLGLTDTHDNSGESLGI